MKNIMFVTEGVTDQIILEEVIAEWLGGEDFVSNRVQPPSSAIAEIVEGPLSEGWRGVMTWCGSPKDNISSAREYALQTADLLVVHVDADVGFDVNFHDPVISAQAESAAICEHVEAAVRGALGFDYKNVVLCVPSLDLECWILCCLYPGIADENSPVEVRRSPAELLLAKNEKLVRRKDGRIRKNTANYQIHKTRVASQWSNCTAGNPVRCVQAGIFETRVRKVLGI
jgi:hypothetical protein